jgi:hypothetical protein
MRRCSGARRALGDRGRPPACRAATGTEAAESTAAPCRAGRVGMVQVNVDRGIEAAEARPLPRLEPGGPRAAKGPRHRSSGSFSRSAPRRSRSSHCNVADTASQPGPVLYRDPLGVISPDGEWFACTEGSRVRARRLSGGPVCELGPAERFVSHLSVHAEWAPDGERLFFESSDSVRAARSARFCRERRGDPSSSGRESISE